MKSNNKMMAEVGSLSQRIMALEEAATALQETLGSINSIFAKKEELPNLDLFAKKTDLADLSPFVRKSELPSLSGLLTEATAAQRYTAKNTLYLDVLHDLHKNKISFHHDFSHLFELVEFEPEMTCIDNSGNGKVIEGKGFYFQIGSKVEVYVHLKIDRYLGSALRYAIGNPIINHEDVRFVSMLHCLQTGFQYHHPENIPYTSPLLIKGCEWFDGRSEKRKQGVELLAMSKVEIFDRTISAAWLCKV